MVGIQRDALEDLRQIRSGICDVVNGLSPRRVSSSRDRYLGLQVAGNLSAD